MRPHTSLLPATLLALASPLLAQEDTRVRWYDVRALEGQGLVLPDGVDLRLHGTAAFLDAMETDAYDVPLEELPPLADLGWSELLLEALGYGWPDEGVFVSERGGLLKVEGTPETQREVARLLAELEAAALRAVELEVWVLPREAVPPGTPAVLRPAELDALLREAPLLEHARGTARLGQRAKLGTEAVASALADYDVEVAGRARTADPQVVVLRTGLELGAVVRERPGGGLFLRAWGRRGRPAGTPRRMTLWGFGGAPLELPAVHTALFAGSAELEDGGALVLDPGRGDEGVCLVRATVGPPDGAPARFVPLGALTATPLLVEPPWLPRTPPSGGWSRWWETVAQQLGDEASEALLSADDVLDEVALVADALGIEARPILAGDALWVPRDDVLLERTRAVVRGLERELVAGTLQLELRFGLRGRDEARRLAADVPAEALAQQLEGRLLGAGRPGDSLCLVAGLQRFTLVDHDVEIAEGAAIADPILATLFEGVSLWCRPLRATGGRVEAWIKLELHELLRAPSEFPVAMWEPDEPAGGEVGVDPEERLPGHLEPTGSVELSATARAALRGTLLLAEDRWTLVGCTPLAGTERALVAVLRVTPVPAGD